MTIQGPFINAPFKILHERLPQVHERKLKPEIYFDASTLDTCSPSMYQDVANSLRSHGIPCTFHAPFEDLQPASFDDRIRKISLQRLRDTCQLAKLFNPLTIVSHTGYWKWVHYEKLEEWMARAVESWKEICTMAQEHGSRILLENVFDDSPEVLARLVQEIGPENVGLCLDIGHLTIFTQCRIEEWLSILGPFIEELHLHDNHGLLDEHLVMGRGTIDFDPLFEYIRDHDRHPIFTLEQHREEDIEPNLRALQIMREKFGV